MTDIFLTEPQEVQKTYLTGPGDPANFETHIVPAATEGVNGKPVDAGKLTEDLSELVISSLSPREE